MAKLLTDAQIEAQVLRRLKRVGPNDTFELTRVFGTEAPRFIREISAAAQAQQIQDLNWFQENIPFAGPLIAWGQEMIIRKEWRKLQVEMGRFATKSANRALYVQQVVAKIYESKKVGLDQWWFLEDLRSPGLMAQMLSYIEAKDAPSNLITEQTTPVCFSIINALPPSDTEDHRQIDSSMWEDLWDEQFVISGQRLAWCTHTKVFEWLMETFPQVINLRAYNHSLNAAILPGGFMPEVPVKLKKLRTIGGVDAETDGSCRAHPSLLLNEIDQFRAQVKATFGWWHVKGIMVADERCVGPNGEPEIWFDLNCVKGAGKADASKMRANDCEVDATAYIGAIGTWDKPTTLNWSFEILQCIKDNRRTREIVALLLKDAYEALANRAMNGLLARIADDNENMNRYLSLIGSINDVLPEEDHIIPIAVPMIKDMVEEKLGRILWLMAQGAGTASDLYVPVMDSAVPRGHIVCAGYKAGETVAAFRYPMVLPQGLANYTAMKPLPHHIISRQLPDGTITRGITNRAVYMNPRDLFVLHQGDDDGDTIGLTNNPLVVELFEHRLDSRVFMIESDGIKFDIMSDTEEGRKYLQENPRGPVGKTTIGQAKVFTVYDKMGAVAAGCANQECVDEHKRKMVRIDWDYAANFANWTYNEDLDAYQLLDPKIQMEQNGVDDDDNPIMKPRESFDEEGFSKWIGGRLSTAGLISSKQFRQQPLGWRYEQEGVPAEKRINPANWVPCEIKSNWAGGNLVHYCHDIALDMWRQIEKTFCLDVQADSIALTLPRALRAHGYDVNANITDWKTYRNGLRNKSGVHRAAERFGRLMRDGLDDEDRKVQWDVAEQQLAADLAHLSLQEVVDVWANECAHSFQDKRGSINHAFRVATSLGSTVMEELGLRERGCSFLTKKRIDAAVEVSLRHENPHAKMANIIITSRRHAVEVVEDGRGVPGWACPHCVQGLQDALVTKIRKLKTAPEEEWKKRIGPALNTAMKERYGYVPGVAPQMPECGPPPDEEVGEVFHCGN